MSQVSAPHFCNYLPFKLWDETLILLPGSSLHLPDVHFPDHSSPLNIYSPSAPDHPPPLTAKLWEKKKAEPEIVSSCIFI